MKVARASDGVGGLPAVLAVHNAYRDRGGEESVFAAEVALLESRGHRVARLEVDNRDLPVRLGPAGTIRLAAQTIWSGAGKRLMARAIRESAPDVVHVHNTFPRLSPSVYSACRAAGVPVVQTIHNYRLICPAATLFRDGHECHDCVGRVPLSGVVHRCYRSSATASATVAAMLTVHRVRRTWARDVDAYVLYSDEAAQLLRHGGLPPDRLHVRGQFVADRSTRQGPGTAIAFVGRLTEAKGFDLVLEVWRQTPDLPPLRVAGDGPLRAAATALAEAGREVTALGHVDAATVQSELLQARALVVASRTHEMSPLTVIEAYAAGVPVIAPAFGVLRSLVADRDTGLLFEPGSASSLAAAVTWARDHPDELEAMGLRARQRYLDRHTPDRAYASLEAIYQAVISQRRAA